MARTPKTSRAPVKVDNGTTEDKKTPVPFTEEQSSLSNEETAFLTEVKWYLIVSVIYISPVASNTVHSLKY